MLNCAAETTRKGRTFVPICCTCWGHFKMKLTKFFLLKKETQSQWWILHHEKQVHSSGANCTTHETNRFKGSRCHSAIGTYFTAVLSCQGTYAVLMLVMLFTCRVVASKLSRALPSSLQFSICAHDTLSWFFLEDLVFWTQLFRDHLF